MVRYREGVYRKGEYMERWCYMYNSGKERVAKGSPSR